MWLRGWFACGLFDGVSDGPGPAGRHSLRTDKV